ncbi:hypothetical protein JZ751_013680, partial [Albula glossodonta]
MDINPLSVSQHQQQVQGAIERAKQGTPPEENSIIQVPLQAGQPLKFTVLETLDRNKEEFEFLQAQYHRFLMQSDKHPHTGRTLTCTNRESQEVNWLEGVF